MAKTPRKPLLSVIVPVYNERRTIELLLEKVRAIDVDKEIIVVDGASEDGTVEILREQKKIPGTRVILQRERRGRGNALKVGIRAARGEYIIFQDADLELDPSDYPSLLKPILDGKADVVFGSRLLRGRPKMGFLQYWGNKVINWSVNILYTPELRGAWLTDVETCYQVFKRDAFRNFQIRNNHFAFTVELTVRLILAGYRIKEIPISYFPRGKAEGKKIYWGDGVASLWTLFRIRIFN
ncbi:MAG TPA: glycosyltransferase family 2 protein [Candidatus Sumerlaeota bacterium]|nr:glycosyltransferase family 2 protein [Candidatus Sumerlaeota bacterium]HMZ52452.1 glycosyltransferase family 2 protein [Candidatus Sumerlaeota bacterium]HNM45876.1 glycosyltransferase family 2 protein [Candidatus Sumerlaeota bacterium]